MHSRPTFRPHAALLSLLFLAPGTGNDAIALTALEAGWVQARGASTRSAAEQDSHIQVAVTAARNLLGRTYDQTMGSDGGRNFASGQIVCVDVPRLALSAAGIPIDKVLERDARLHPGRYPRESGDNIPGHPIFARRTRNWLRWCRGNGRLLPPTATPRPGDVVFYGDRHIAFVSEVEPGGRYQIVENGPGPGRVLEQFDWMLELRGFRPTGFGRIWPLPQPFAALAETPRMIVARELPAELRLVEKSTQHPGIDLLASLYDRAMGRERTPADAGSSATLQEMARRDNWLRDPSGTTRGLELVRESTRASETADSSENPEIVARAAVPEPIAAVVEPERSESSEPSSGPAFFLFAATPEQMAATRGSVANTTVRASIEIDPPRGAVSAPAEPVLAGPAEDPIGDMVTALLAKPATPSVVAPREPPSPAADPSLFAGTPEQIAAARSSSAAETTREIARPPRVNTALASRAAAPAEAETPVEAEPVGAASELNAFFAGVTAPEGSNTSPAEPADAGSYRKALRDRVRRVMSPMLQRVGGTSRNAD